MVSCANARLYAYDGLDAVQPVAQNFYDQDAFFYDDRDRLCYDDGEYTSACVIDVSAYQKEIDWQQVAADGVTMAMIRVGYRGYESGSLHMDAYFRQNIEGAMKAGLKVGIYFFSQAVSVDEAIEEARFVINAIKGYAVDGPVAFDLEKVSNDTAQRIDGLSRTEKTEITAAFCQVIERKGYTPMIYGNATWFTEAVELGHLTAYPLWLAHYADETAFPDEFALWQYTNKGRVAGITGNVDLNLWFLPAKVV